ncbi:hypothetical protein BTO06_08280 [Tenacibaculum sp. SZ-18]|uniref:hypothetical protein n=1 Tax=Tenacibaculum sp. SZ-18 TaxID=754423 RepID=UPI000C2CFEA2|nr:hypothetical protein [Tenacibaculum sp. SZ-18]AUC15133.1 hypothetical protein BTO06_08280 [Tenacibaculum sp. SZ-18]
MRLAFLFCIVILSFISCKVETTGNADRFKHGTFEIPAVNNYSKTKIIRKDSLQIEYYTKKVIVSTDSSVVEKEINEVDSLYITWRNNFAYQLKIINPKTDLEKETIFVQINKVKDSSYDFTARVGYSKYKQKGTLYISRE